MNRQPKRYLQTDPRWADADYSAVGERTDIRESGCGPTCAAMLIETLTGREFTPADACTWSRWHGYKAPHQGTYYSYFTPQFKVFGLECRQLNGGSVYGQTGAAVHGEALSLLKEGHYLIACMGRGLWTSSGHFVVVWWEDGRVFINDPASTAPARTRGDPAVFRAQVKYYWAVDARAYNEEESELTKEEIAAIVSEVLDDRETSANAKPVADWASEPWARLTVKGVVDGSRPWAPLTRQEEAVILDRLTTL